MKIILTGSHGFIGSHLKQHFHSRNLVCIPHQDLYSIDTIRPYVEDTEYIFHCASYGNMAHHKDRDKILKANLLTTHNLLLATEDIKYKSFIYLSSSSVYGEKTHPMTETDTLDALDPYGMAKILTELYIESFVHQTDKPVSIARLFSVYGEGEADYRFIPTCLRAIRGEPMNIAHGMHDWIYIQDVIEALLRIQLHADELKGSAINIGTGIQTDNYEVLRVLCEFAKADIMKLNLTHIPELRTKKIWVADNNMLQRLGWIQQFSLREGLKKVWNSQT